MNYTSPAIKELGKCNRDYYIPYYLKQEIENLYLMEKLMRFSFLPISFRLRFLKKINHDLYMQIVLFDKNLRKSGMNAKMRMEQLNDEFHITFILKSLNYYKRDIIYLSNMNIDITKYMLVNYEYNQWRKLVKETARGLLPS